MVRLRFFCYTFIVMNSSFPNIFANNLIDFLKLFALLQNSV
nr:MAG TPA: hypothetical protein [Herelleviridae sp.]